MCKLATFHHEWATRKDPELDEFYRILELHWSEHRDDPSSDEEDPALLAIEDGAPGDGYEAIDGHVAEDAGLSVRRALFESGEDAMETTEDEAMEAMEEEAMEQDEEVTDLLKETVAEPCPPPLPDLPSTATPAAVLQADGLSEAFTEPPPTAVASDGGMQHDFKDNCKQQDFEDKQLASEGGKQRDFEDKRLASEGGKQHEQLDELAKIHAAEQMKERLRQGLQAKVALLRPRSM